MKKTILVIIVLLQSSALSQNLDSLYNALLRLKPEKNIKSKTGQTIQTEKNKPLKCGFGLAADVKRYFNDFSIEQQQTIKQILSRPTLEKSFVSQSGIFRIHYNASGYNKPNYFPEESVEYNVAAIAAAFDSSYNYEVNILGYLPPPKDNMNGGDNKFDIYIQDMNGGNYALTTTDSSLGNNKYTSYIQIDNDFRKSEGYHTFGIEAAKATAAHEFHHAIQMGNYILNLDDRFYHELTSTAMEETVFDEVNDYYYYIHSFYNDTEKSFIKHDGYDLAVWNIYLRQRFGGEVPNTGDAIIKRSWELMAKPNGNKAIIAVAKAISEFGYSFKDEFKNFALWNYFTNEHTKQNKYFEEAKSYPPIKLYYKYDFTSPKQTLDLKNIEPVSIRYIRFLDNSQGLPDTIISIFSDSDVKTASTNPSNYNQVTFTLANNSFDGAKKITDNYYYKVEGNLLQNISESYIINNEPADENIERKEIEYVYPQPYTYDLNSSIFIPTYADISGEAELNIYSSDMNLVYSKTHKIILSDRISVTWNGLNNNGNKLASGVYIYVTKVGGKIKKGKIVILNK